MASAKFFTIVFTVFFMGAMIEQSSAQWYYYYPVEYEVPVYEYVAPYYYYGKRSSGFSPDDQQPQKRSYNPKFKKF